MEEKPNWTYCVTGNITKTHYDEVGTLRYGTAAFTGGSKVYLCGRFWSIGDKYIDVIGKNRRGRYQVVKTDVSHIENVRCQRVFKPGVLEIMNNFEFYNRWWGKSKKEKADAEAFINRWEENRKNMDGGSE